MSEGTDLEFFLDPVCPWCWITSRWVCEVQRQRDYDVRWRFISLRFLNEEGFDYPSEEYRQVHHLGTKLMRVADEVDRRHGNDALGRAYTAFGTAIHVDRRRDEALADPRAFAASCLASAGLDGADVDELAAHVDDESHDEHLRAETKEALERTGPDVGTPILTFVPGTEREGSFFGPVIAKAPRGDEASRLWDAVETLATTGVAELKRSLRGRPEFD